MLISDWSSDVCSSDLVVCLFRRGAQTAFAVLGCDDQLVQQLDGIDRVHDSLLANRMSAVAEAGLAMAGAAANGRFSLARSRRAARSFHRIGAARSEEHTSELQSLMRISYAVFCLKKKNTKT